MMRKILFALALGFSLSAMAQVMNVTSIEKVNLPEQAAVAAISPQGDYLLLTSATNQGLTKYDLASGQTQVLSTAPSAGHNVKISPNGQTVVFQRYAIVQETPTVGQQERVDVIVEGFVGGGLNGQVKPVRVGDKLATDGAGGRGGGLGAVHIGSYFVQGQR